MGYWRKHAFYSHRQLIVLTLKVILLDIIIVVVYCIVYSMKIVNVLSTI